ncbi:MAG: autotransporter-associated beta strand repeat-containing protein [Akkermansiaceae bacterium]
MKSPFHAFIHTVAGILLIPCAHAAPYTWDASGASPLDDGGGSWNPTGGTNWFNGTGYGAWGNTSSDVATFGVGNGAAGTINVGTVNANGITFNAAGSGNYALSGGTITLGGTAPTINAAVNASISSVLAGSAGMTKSGAGTLSLTGVSTYSGGTIIDNGTLSLESTTTDTAIRGTVTVNSGGTLRIAGVAWGGFGATTGKKIDTLNVVGGTVNNTLNTSFITNATVNMTGGTISGGEINWRNTTLNSLASADTATVSSKIILRNDFVVANLVIDTADGAAATDLRIGGAITQSSSGGTFVNVGLVKNGAGTLELTGANTYRGSTTINNGTLALGNSNRLYDSGALNVSGGTFSIGTYSETLGAVTLTSGAISGSSGILTGSSYAVESGTVSAILAGTGALAKTTAGTLELTNINTYGGGTTVNDGNLLLNSSSTSSAAVRGTVTVNTGATLTVSGGNFGGFGTTTDGSKIDTLDVVGGSVVVTGDKMNKDATFNLTGGTISGGKISWRNSALNSLASATASTISSNIMIRNDFEAGLPLTINVADGGAADDLVIGGVISQPGTTGASVIKTGAGTLKLTNTNSYTGGTTVNAGKLWVTGNISTSVLTTVKDTATLSGSGFVGAVNVESGGIIAPGSSAGNLTVSNGLTIAGIYQWELATLSTASPGTNFDLITLTTGNADITGASLGLNLGSFAPTAIPFWQIDQTWAGILNNTGAGSLTGTFAAINNTLWSSLGSFSTSYTGNDVNLVWTAVPEPSSFLTGGLLVTAGLLRRRRAGQATMTNP